MKFYYYCAVNFLNHNHIKIIFNNDKENSDYMKIIKNKNIFHRKYIEILGKKFFLLYYMIFLFSFFFFITYIYFCFKNVIANLLNIKIELYCNNITIFNEKLS